LPSQATPTSIQVASDVGLPRQVKVLAGISVVVALGFGIVSPALPLLAKQFGVGHAAAGLAISVFAFLRFASAVANGKLAERYGERALLAAGLGLQAVTTVAAGLAPDFTMVIAMRAVGGLGSAAFTVSALALVLRTSSPGTRARAASLYQGGFLIGAVGGPAIGGFLTEITPRLPFVVYGVLLAVAGTIGLVLLRDPWPTPEHSSEHPVGVVLAERNQEGLEVPHSLTGQGDQPVDRQRPLGLRSRAFFAAVVLNLGSGWMLYGLRNSLVPVYAIEELHQSAGWVGLCFLAASAVQVLVLLRAGRWADTWGRRPTMIMGATTGLVASILLTLPPQTATFLFAMTGLGVAAAFISGSPPAVVGDVSPHSTGRGVAIYSMASDFGAVVGPLSAGWLADHYSYPVAFASSVVILALGLLTSLIMQETRTRESNLI
jgi:MFS family permease